MLMFEQVPHMRVKVINTLLPRSFMCELSTLEKVEDIFI